MSGIMKRDNAILTTKISKLRWEVAELFEARITGLWKNPPDLWLRELPEGWFAHADQIALELAGRITLAPVESINSLLRRMPELVVEWCQHNLPE